MTLFWNRTEKKSRCLSTVLIRMHQHSTTSSQSCKDQSYYSCTHVPAFHWPKHYRGKKLNGTRLVHWLCKRVVNSGTNPISTLVWTSRLDVCKYCVPNHSSCPELWTIWRDLSVRMKKKKKKQTNQTSLNYFPCLTHFYQECHLECLLCCLMGKMLKNLLVAM